MWIFPHQQAEKSLQNQHVLSILQVGSHQLQYRFFRTKKPKSRVIGQNVLVEGLVPGVVVGGGVVEFVPANCVAPAGDGAGGLAGLTGLVPGVFEGCVGGHGGQDCRCWLGGEWV